MRIFRSTLARPLIAVAIVVASSLFAIAQQPPSPSRVRGAIESVDGDVLSVKSRSGEDVKLRMTGDVRVVGIIKISLSDIKLGSFVGTTTVPGPDGRQNAVEVHVFPEDMRGTGEGSRPYDLRPNSTMTNATVAETVSRLQPARPRGGQQWRLQRDVDQVGDDRLRWQQVRIDFQRGLAVHAERCRVHQ